MWFWVISSIAGSILGSATESWFRDTRLGVWFYAKIDKIYTWASKKYGLKILTDEEKQMKKFPQLEERLVIIEKQLQELKRDEIHNYSTDYVSISRVPNSTKD